MDRVTEKSQTDRTEFYCQWFDTRRGAWVTPTDWLRSGGYATYQEASTEGVAWCRQDSPKVRVRVVGRVTHHFVMDEIPVPNVEPDRCTDPDCPTAWAEHDKH